jgi:hypothetical protein
MLKSATQTQPGLIRMVVVESYAFGAASGGRSLRVMKIFRAPMREPRKGVHREYVAQFAEAPHCVAQEDVGEEIQRRRLAGCPCSGGPA